MSIPSIYLETTIFNFPFVDDAPQYKTDTLKLFAEIKEGKFKPFTSTLVTEELELTKNEERLAKMKALINDYKITVIEPNDEMKELADTYIKVGIIPERFLTDAFHIAVATVYGLDFIVSLNFRHIVKHKTIIQTEAINAILGFGRIYIHTPAEVINYEKDA